MVNNKDTMHSVVGLALRPFIKVLVISAAVICTLITLTATLSFATWVVLKMDKSANAAAAVVPPGLQMNISHEQAYETWRPGDGVFVSVFCQTARDSNELTALYVAGDAAGLEAAFSEKLDAGVCFWLQVPITGILMESEKTYPEDHGTTWRVKLASGFFVWLYLDDRVGPHESPGQAI